MHDGDNHRMRTDSRDLAKALRESEATNRALLAVIADGMFRMSRDGTYVDYTAAKGFQTYVPASEFLGRRVADVLPPTVAALVTDHMEKAFTTGEVQIFQYSLPLLGEVRDYEARLVALGDDEILSVVHEVTESNLAKAALREAHETLTALVQAAPLAVIALDRDYRVKIWNPAAESMFGYTAGEVLGRRLPLIPNSDWDQFLADMQRIREVGTERAFETQRRHKDGSMIDVAISRGLLRGGDGNIVGHMAILADIRENKRMREVLRASEERFGLFMAHLPGVAFMKDVEGRYVYVNRGFEKKMGIDAEHCMGKRDDQLWAAPFAEEFMAGDRSVVETGRPLNSVEAVPPMDRPRYFRVIKFPVLDSERKVMLVGGVAIDITEQRRASEALRDSQAELQQSREELRTLTARLLAAQEEERRRVSRELHDELNQQLAVLAVDVGSLVKSLPATDYDVRGQLRALQARVAKLSDAVRHIAYQLHPSILDDLGLLVALRSHCEELSRHEGMSVRMTHRNVPDSLPPELASCLYRVAQEGLRNIIRHAGTTHASLSLTSASGDLRLSIRDTGAGFDAKTRDHHGGLGILSMEERVRLVNGTISIHSRPGRGTRIDVRVPLPKEVQ